MKTIKCYALEGEVVDGRYQIKSRTETGSVTRSEGLYDIGTAKLKDLFVTWAGLERNSFNLIMRGNFVMAMDLDGVALFELEEMA